ncbi:MAG: HutD family protein [Rhodobacteraceae bacterium]|nr:HutD family protein [Paracoccaceae bacterium]
MQVIRPGQFIRQPWKNGGGVTHEIVKVTEAEDLLWRLSVAEVAADGPFSSFPGLTRCLTVIAGDGIDLETPDGVLAAPPLVPVYFSGDTAVTGRLRNGPIRDLNLIFDAARITATVTTLFGPLTTRETCGTRGDRRIFCVTGAVSANGQDLPPCALAGGDIGRVSLGPGAAALMIDLSPARP